LGQKYDLPRRNSIGNLKAIGGKYPSANFHTMGEICKVTPKFGTANLKTVLNRVETTFKGPNELCENFKPAENSTTKETGVNWKM